MNLDSLLLRNLFDLFEWAFAVRLDEADRREFADELLAGWGDGDTSEQLLVLELMQGWAALAQLPPAVRVGRRPYVANLLWGAMSEPRPDDCGRVLHRLQAILGRHGVGGAARTAQPTVDAQAAMAEAARYNARVNSMMNSSMEAHRAQMDAIMAIGGWQRVQ